MHPTHTLRGGFPPLKGFHRRGDPDRKHLLPEYPPQPNDFYELSSDGRVTERYFENRNAFKSDPHVSYIAKCFSPPAKNARLRSNVLAELSPTRQASRRGNGALNDMLLLHCGQENMHPQWQIGGQNQGLITGGQQRRAITRGRTQALLEKPLSMDRVYIGNPSQKMRNGSSKDERGEFYEKQIFDHLAEQPKHNAEFLQGWIWKQEKAFLTSKTHIRQNFEGEIQCGGALENSSIALINDHSEYQNSARHITKDSLPPNSMTTQDHGLMEYEKRTVCFLQIPGSRSGLNTRTGRSRSDLELSIHQLVVPDEDLGQTAYSPERDFHEVEMWDSEDEGNYCGSLDSSTKAFK